MRMPAVQTDFFTLKGGLNLVTPPLAMPDGMCRDSLNFDGDIDAGYRRIAGYERYDGRTSPSSVTFFSMGITSWVGTVSNGDTVTGATSGATATVIASDDDFIYIAQITGTFETGGESIEVSATEVATTSTGTMVNGAPSPKLTATYTNLAADVYRADIGAVPGAGSVLGVWVYNDDVYAFRNNVGNTAAVMHKGSAAGWVAIDLNNEISFTDANTSVGEGDTLTQGGVTATILRVVLQSGSLASGTNTGRLILGAVSGGNFAAGAATSTGSGAVTLGGAQTAITLPAGGKYEFVQHNFGGLSGTRRMYGASGVGRMFEFDGTVFVPLETGLPVDTPTHIAVHLNQLYFSFGSSLQRSGVGDPYVYTIITGAAELAIGDDITELVSMIGSNSTGALAVFSLNQTQVLYGSTDADVQLVTFSTETGAAAYTGQQIGDIYVLDQQGVRQLSSSDQFGNFADSQITRLIRPWIRARTGGAVGSAIIRDRSQYRIYYSDGHALHITFDNGRVRSIMPILTAHTFNCITSREDTTGDEVVLAGGTDGFVYRLDKGTSFDGEEISYFMVLAFSFMKGPRIRKSYKRAVYEVTGGSYSEISATYELGYGSTDIVQGSADPTTLASTFGEVNWDNFTWDNFYWDGRTLSPSSQKLHGSGENISLILRGLSDEYASFTINSAIIQYIPRRLLR